MIIGEIRRYLRDNNSIRISRSVRDLAYRALQAREELTREKEYEPSVDKPGFRFKGVEMSKGRQGQGIGGWDLGQQGDSPISASPPL